MNSHEQSDGALKYPELVFGLVGAVGTDNEKIITELKAALIQVNYDLVAIKVINHLGDEVMKVFKV